MAREGEMFSYTAYGLTIRSELAMPELLTSEEAHDVVVRFGRVEARPPIISDRGNELWADPKEARFCYSEAGSALIRGGREIVIEPAPGVDEGVLRLFILGPVFAMLLHQRGFLVLHANAVKVNGAAVAFLGKSGQGKSTMAAALYKREHAVVSDDVTAVRLGEGAPEAYPGFPRLKLWPETVESLGEDLEEMPRLNPWIEKRDRRVVRGFPASPLPLERIYVLTDGSDQGIEPMRKRDAFIALVKNSYPVVANLLDATGSATSHFRQCEKLSGLVPILSLKRKLSLSALPDLTRLVEEDLAALSLA